MSVVRRNTDPLKGPPDGVAADLQCVVTQFDRSKETGATQRAIAGQATMPCTVLCSYDNGTVGISIRELDLQLDLLVSDMMEVMRAAAEANRELTAPQREQYSDADLEEKWRKLQNVVWCEADSPSGSILADTWWVFPKGADLDDVWAWFNERHSKGLEHLKHMLVAEILN